MTTFRQKSTGTKTTNFEGGEAFKESDKLELVSLLLTSFVSDKFYESSDTQLQRLADLVNNIKDKEFVAKAAIYARTEFGMRSITHALLGELTNTVKGKEWVKRAIQKAMYRPDDMMETLGYYMSKYKKPIPNSLKKGLRMSLKNFDSYQLAKYRGDKTELKLVDIFNLTHPKPNSPEEEKLYTQIVEGKLKSKDTWETKHTQAGQKASKIEDKTEREAKLKELKNKNWTDLLTNKKLGYFALLRNLRNIIEQAPDMIDDALEQLTDEKAIKNSLIMPFRFYSAYKEIKKVGSTQSGKVMDALGKALTISCQNIPDMKGKTLVAIDTSYSMSDRISPKSVVERKEIAALLGAMIFEKSGDTVTMNFADTLKVSNLRKGNDVLANMEILLAKDAGAGSQTNGFLVPEYARENKLEIDNFLIFTDLQMYDAKGVTWSRTPPAPGRSFKKEIEKYRKEINPNAKVFSFDCAGYGTLQMPENDPLSYLIPGFSEKMFDLIEKLQEDRKVLLKKIEEIEL